MATGVAFKLAFCTCDCSRAPQSFVCEAVTAFVHSRCLEANKHFFSYSANLGTLKLNNKEGVEGFGK